MIMNREKVEQVIRGGQDAGPRAKLIGCWWYDPGKDHGGMAERPTVFSFLEDSTHIRATGKVQKFKDPEEPHVVQWPYLLKRHPEYECIHDFELPRGRVYLQDDQPVLFTSPQFINDPILARLVAHDYRLNHQTLLRDSNTADYDLAADSPFKPHA